MTGSTHKLGGLVAGIIVIEGMSQQVSITQKVLLLSASVVGSIILDIDNHRSTISSKLPGLRFLVGILQGIARFFAVFLPKKQEKYVRSMVGHRGISHSIFMVISSYLIIRLLGCYFSNYTGIFERLAISTSAGIISHILLDMFAGGVPLLAPLCTKRFTLANIKTGGPVEWMLRTAATFIIILFICMEGAKWNLI